ncbi:DUF4054 domain-containing protein [Sphingomonas xinjiangensis]|uniref:DUF4054 domain-containing protein n=1 Tax=Sphingomonas xinjiangensis TaxID=643568 RepID=A0A840YNY3_9SPHN|nr:DUF4054 domain-containing protein [Sphingomonas xinjiangensis]MBB5709342.1 hypothetical protein [Sphingomonas xinjiangensis]
MPYTQPTADEFRKRFPAFAAVPADTIEYWLQDARLIVTESWAEVDRAPAEMTLAAHNMSENGVLGGTGAVGDLRTMGVTDFKSASMSVSFDSSVGVSTGYKATRYGRAFEVFLRRNVGGPRLVGTLSPGWCG